MNIAALERKLLAAAKVSPPSEVVPYGFERRIMARLGSAPVFDIWAEWSRALWRAAAPCVAIAMLLGLWAAFAPAARSAAPNLSDELEQTILVAVTHDNDSTW